MEYSLAGTDIATFYNAQYLHGNISSGFSFTDDIIKTNLLEMSINEWKTPKLKVQQIQMEAKKDTYLQGCTPDGDIILHFVCKGQTLIEGNEKYPSVIKQNTNNLFSPISEKVNHLLKKGQINTYLKVFLPKTYIYFLIENHPNLFGCLAEALDNQCPLLKEGNLPTTLDMKQVIEQIKNASLMGNVGSLYFETKIQELLVLQLQQVDKHNCPECRNHKYYKSQLYEARNYIENRFQNPPSIAELAQMVGMSETVLKANFKSYFGLTIYGYLFDYRMGIARKYLSDKSLSIAEIAYKSGYENPSHFTTAFKRKFGVSPVEYRLKHI